VRAARTLVGLVLLLVVGLPLLRLASELLAHPGALAAWADPLALRAAANTAGLAVGVTLLALSLGVPLGVLLARAEGLEHPGWRALVTLPYVVPPYVSAIAWITLLNPTTGWLNGPLRAMGLPALDIYGLPGMIFVIGLESTPLVVLAVADALDRLDASLEEQARVANASPLRATWRVTLPLCAPALAAAAAVVFAGAAASFGVPYLLASGSPDPDWVLTTRIASALDLDPASGRPRAVAWSVGLLLLSMAVPALLGLLLSRRTVTVGGKAARPARLHLGRWRSGALGAVLAFVLLGVGLPLLTLLALSITDQVGRPFGPANWSLEHYVAVLGRARDRAALLRSAGYAAVAATAAVGVGTAIALLERDSQGRRWLSSLARLPYTIPGTVLALGLLLAWSQEIRIIVLERVTFALALADTGWLLMLAYGVKFLALPVGAVAAALRSFDPALDEAARICGASALRTVRRITLPLLVPTLAASWILVFLPAFTEVTMSVLLSGPQTRVVGAVLFELQTYGDPPGAAALGVVVSVLVVGLQLCAFSLQRRSP
jgi:iron(III) transport system permease protein